MGDGATFGLEELGSILQRVEGKLDRLIANQAAPRSAQQPAPPKSAAGGSGGSDPSDPEVRYIPKFWRGRDYMGRRYSQTEPAFLDQLAKYHDWRAANPLPGKEHFAALATKDAAAARGWAAKMRAGGAGELLLDSPPPAHEHGSEALHDDIPFAFCDSARYGERWWKPEWSAA